MIVFVPLVPREIAKKEVQEKYKHSVQTANGTITFAYVNPGEYLNRWGIYEYSTGLSIMGDIGKLSKHQFIKIVDLIAMLGSRRIKDCINENEKINEVRK